MDYITALERLATAIGPAATARRLHITPRTLRRWRAGHTRPHAHIARLIELEARDAFRDLPPPWNNWRIAPDGKLYEWDGEARGVTPADVRTIFHLHTHIRTLENELRTARALIDELQNQPAPGTHAPLKIRLNGA